MKTILRYIKGYFYELDKRLLIFCTLLTALLIYLNYHYQVDNRISDQPAFIARFSGRYFIYLIAFALPYLAYSILGGSPVFRKYKFVLLVLVSPAIFAMKAGLSFSFLVAGDPAVNDYWNHILYWPLLLILVMAMIFACWRIFDPGQPFYGIRTRDIDWKPYWIMLLIMVPLVALASTQPDFQAVYPKLSIITGHHNGIDLQWWHKLLFELSYGSDFVSIELFFRGFLVLAFIKWAGKDAILPMACFYCTIHFGKPLGECISSFFGGILLGVVVANTRSIWGGLMVHLGIAWLMELGGYIGSLVAGK